MILVFYNLYQLFIGKETSQVLMKLHLLSVTEIEDDFPSHVEIPDLFFPFAQADITECSTYAVVCRLKPSPTYTITSKGGSFSHPDYPGVKVTIPENAVASNAEFPLELKVGLMTFTTYVVVVVFFFRNWLICSEKQQIDFCLTHSLLEILRKNAF